MKAVFHNVGLGDHILCNGMIRELYSQYGELALFVVDRNYDNVAFMFSDLENLKLIRIDSKMNCYKFVESVSGFEVMHIAGGTHGVGFEEAFYKRAGIDFGKKWDSFYVPRCIEKEKKLFDSLGLKEGAYAFVHEWNNLKIPDAVGIKNVRPYKELGGVFDFCYIIENASEIHCMESSFKNLIEFLDIKTSNLYFYKGREGSRSLSKLNWKEM